MIVQLLLLTQLIACEDTKEEPPPPPTAQAAPEEKKPEPPKKEEKSEEAKAEGAATDGTAPKVSTQTKLIATGEVKAAQSKLLLSNVKRQLKARAKKEGFSGVKDVKLTKQTCSGGSCTGIGQGTAFKTIVAYEAGNAVAVKQEDASMKNAIIKEIKDNKYVVTYEDASEATVEKAALSVRKKEKAEEKAEEKAAE